MQVQPREATSTHLSLESPDQDLLRADPTGRLHAEPWRAPNSRLLLAEVPRQDPRLGPFPTPSAPQTRSTLALKVGAMEWA